jgi:hypothetical protein
MGASIYADIEKRVNGEWVSEGQLKDDLSFTGLKGGIYDFFLGNPSWEGRGLPHDSPIAAEIKNQGRLFCDDDYSRETFVSMKELLDFDYSRACSVLIYPLHKEECPSESTIMDVICGDWYFNKLKRIQEHLQCEPENIRFILWGQ